MRIEGLCFAYDDFRVFWDFSFESQARVIALRGPTGCGKTTLLKLLSGVLRPASVKRFEASTGSCLILQEDSLLPWLSGTNNLTKILRIPIHSAETNPMYELIAGHVHKKACAMSYGQRRLIELFRAVVYRPKLLCLDEPFNFLDPQTRQAVKEYLNGSALRETRIVLSTHHEDDLNGLEAEKFTFDGNFPISALRKS